MGSRPIVKVLLVDDDEEDLELNGDILLRAPRLKFEVTAVASPAQGLELLCSEAFDIALVDFEMGVTDGLELLRDARTRGCKTPVVLLTGHQDDSLAEDALGAGVADYLEKSSLGPVLVERVILYAIERMRAFREVDDAANRVRFMLNTTPGIAWEADSEGKLLFVSKRWIEMVGEEGEAQSLFAPIHHDDRAAAIQSWHDARTQGLEWRAEYRLRLLGGGYRWVLSRATRGDHRAANSSWIGLSVTVDEQKELELDLQKRVAESTEELEDVQVELESVSYAMVHDMRSPVRAIIATSSELMEEFPDAHPDMLAGLARQRTVGRRMHALVDGMIQYIRLIRSSLQVRSFDASSVCREVIDQIYSEGGMYGATIEVPAGLILVGDQAVIRILVKSLLENAVKFRTSERPNRVTVSQHSNLNGLCVQDDGIGFDPKYMNKIVLPFERLHRDDEYVGVGIGLAIAQRAVARHSGALTFKPVLGEGVTACFTLGLSLHQ